MQRIAYGRCLAAVAIVAKALEVTTYSVESLIYIAPIKHVAKKTNQLDIL